MWSETNSGWMWRTQIVDQPVRERPPTHPTTNYTESYYFVQEVVWRRIGHGFSIPTRPSRNHVAFTHRISDASGLNLRGHRNMAGIQIVFRFFLVGCSFFALPERGFAGWHSSGGDILADSQNPWFTGKESAVHYCIKLDSTHFSASEADAQAAIQQARFGFGKVI